jgi:hypothetical protein
MAEENIVPQVVVDDRPTWRKWLEFVQLIGVLLFGLAFVLPFAVGSTPMAWTTTAVSITLGCLLVAWSLTFIPKVEIAVSDQRYEVTQTRLNSLRTTGTPENIVGSIAEMNATGRWNGTAQEFRDSFYSLVGSKIGRVYLPRVLPYLVVYDVKPKGTPPAFAHPDEARMPPLGEQPLK